jgi:excisionase family DNA binding protein
MKKTRKGGTHMENESSGKEMTIVLEQRANPVVRQDISTAYLVAIMKKQREEIEAGANAGAKYDLSQLKDKKLLSVEEASDLFGIGRGKIRELSNSERCPFVLWVGGHRKIKREAFEAYLRDQYSV